MKTLKRIFKFEELELGDPNPNFMPELVIDHYSSIYPKLTTAVINDTQEVGDCLIYDLVTVAENKG